MAQKKTQLKFIDYFLIYPDMDNQGLLSKRSVFISQVYVLIMTVLAWLFKVNSLFIYGVILLTTGILTTLIYHIKNGKNADFFIFGGFAVGILASLAFVIRQGGIAESGGLILAGPIIIILSLIFQRKEWSVTLVGLYIITLLAAAFIGPKLSAYPPLSNFQNVLFFSGNALLLAYLILEMMIILFQKSEQADVASKAMRDRTLSMNTMKSNLYIKLTRPFKSPLSDIQTMVRMIRSEVDPAVRNKLEQIDADSRYLLTIIQHMQDLTLLEAEKLKLNRIQSDFIPFTKYISKYYKDLAERKGITLSFNSNMDQFNLDFDPDKVQALLSNLLSDAILRSTKKDEIVLTVNRERENSFKDFVEIILSDKGSTLSQDKINLIRHPEKHKWDNNSESIDWMDLAYNYAGYLIRAMEGNVFVRSKSGGGNRIRIHLPVHNAAPFHGQDEVQQKLHIVPFIQPIYTKEKPGKDQKEEGKYIPASAPSTAAKNSVGNN